MFEIEEIRYAIAALVDYDDDGHRSRSWLSLALVNKSFFRPAMLQLWDEVSGINQLLDVLSPKTKEDLALVPWYDVSSCSTSD